MNLNHAQLALWKYRNNGYRQIEKREQQTKQIENGFFQLFDCQCAVFI